MPIASTRTNSIPLSGIREMMDLALTIPNVLRLEIGDPDFMTPSSITEAAAKWARDNRIGYPPNAGISSLREAAARKVTETNHIPCLESNINITIGATGALYLALLAILEPGDEVAVPDPGWAGYPAMVALAGGVVKPYLLRPENAFRLSVSDLAEVITPRTKAVIVNSPSNPTGAINSPSELRALVRLATERDIWIVADECYDQVVFDDKAAYVGTFADLETGPVISAFSFSKTYAMTGWRVGYLVTSTPMASQVARMQAASFASASVVSQVAALAALNGSQEPNSAMVAAYARRRDIATSLLDTANIPYIRPQGALYIFVDIRQCGITSRDFAMALLRERSVCTTPGVAFGQNGEGFIRVSLACSELDLAEGLSRMIDFIGKKTIAVR